MEASHFLNIEKPLLTIIPNCPKYTHKDPPNMKSQVNMTQKTQLIGRIQIEYIMIPLENVFFADMYIWNHRHQREDKWQNKQHVQILSAAWHPSRIFLVFHPFKNITILTLTILLTWGSLAPPIFASLSPPPSSCFPRENWLGSGTWLYIRLHIRQNSFWGQVISFWNLNFRNNFLLFHWYLRLLYELKPNCSKIIQLFLGCLIMYQNSLLSLQAWRINQLQSI